MPEFRPHFPLLAEIINAGSIENRAKLYAESLAISSPVRTALKLQWYNFFSRNPQPTDDMLEHQGDISLQLAQIESQRRSSPLVTIGTEVEGEFSEASRDTLQKLGIRCKEQLSTEGKHINLWEIASRPSYAAETQNVILQQLVHAGIASRIPGLGANDLIDGTEKRLSLHINLGVPPDLTYHNTLTLDFRDHIILLNDALTLAYTSAERAQQRKTSDSWDVKNAERMEGTQELSPLRLELRAGELTEHLSYDMLMNTQRLATCMFQYIRMRTKKILTPQQQAFATIWNEFADNMRLLREQRDIPPNFVDDKPTAARVFAEAESAGTREDIRHYIQLAAGRAEKITA